MDIDSIIDRVSRNKGRHIVLHRGLSNDGMILDGFQLLLNQPKDYDFHRLPEFVTECNKNTFPDLLESHLEASSMKRFDPFNNGEDIVDGVYCLLFANGKAAQGRVMRLREGNDEEFHFSGWMVDSKVEDSPLVGYALKMESLGGFSFKNTKIIKS